MSAKPSLASAALARNAEAVVTRVLLLVAMEAEAQPTIDALKLVVDDTILPAHVPGVAYRGTFGAGEGKDGDASERGEIAVIVSKKDSDTGVDSVGTVPAALYAFAAIQNYNPDLVINAGTCGGFARHDGKVGDAYICHQFVNHDRRIDIPGTPFKEYGVGARTTTPCAQLLATLGDEVGLKAGVTSSGNSLDCLPADDERLVEHAATCKDMEAAAIAYVATLSATPFFAVKVVTDVVDGGETTSEEFMANLSSAAESLQRVLPKVLGFVFGRKVGEL
jgi:5'-methylthioadenosine nucleosidase